MVVRIVGNPRFGIKLEDVDREVYLVPISRCGTMVKLENVLAKDMEIQTLEDGSIRENPNGFCLFKLKTNDENFKNLYFVYEGGFYLDWEMSKKGKIETIIGENYMNSHVKLFEKYILEIQN